MKPGGYSYTSANGRLTFKGGDAGGLHHEPKGLPSVSFRLSACSRMAVPSNGSTFLLAVLRLEDDKFSVGRYSVLPCPAAKENGMKLSSFVAKLRLPC